MRNFLHSFPLSRAPVVQSCRAGHTIVGRTPEGVVQQRPLPRRVLRRVLETAFEKVLRRVLRRCLAVCFTRRKGSEKGSEKGF